MVINTQSFLKNPDMYSDAVVLTGDAYEEYETLKALAEAEEDIVAGRVFSHDEVFSALRAKINAKGN